MMAWAISLASVGTVVKLFTFTFVIGVADHLVAEGRVFDGSITTPSALLNGAVSSTRRAAQPSQPKNR